MQKTKRLITILTLLIAAIFFINSANLPAGTVQAASKGTYRAILQAYRKNDVKYGGVGTETTIWVYEYKGGKYKTAKGAVYETWYPSLYNYTSGNGLVLQERGISEDYCETVTLVTLSKGRIKAKIIRNRYFNSPKQKTTMPCQIKIYTR